MRELLIVVDMQNDFIDGALGSAEAAAIVSSVTEKVRRFAGEVIFTRDTHTGDYLNTQEGRKLPVVHCVKGSHGWQICDALEPYTQDRAIFDKPGFSSFELAEYIMAENVKEKIDSITLIGLCTDICVICNAMILKGMFPEITVSVDAECCAGITPESHENALKAMRMCQIEV
ncbi:MAG: isochorismatase family cysteine hydrolase [Eubacteriales bacterium]|nr:isochorismatase family cysteine hydrolase [Eubacteriales bacterium]